MSGTAVEKEVSVKSHNFSWLQLSKRKGQPFSVIVQFFMKAIFNFPAQKNCHSSNVMFIFLTQNQKNKKRCQ